MARATTARLRAAETQGGYPIVLVLGCAFSAGVHFALVPGHIEESAALGLAFAAAGVLLLALALGVFMQPRSPHLLAGMAALLAALLAGYLASRTVGLPGLEPEPEPFDAVGLLSKAAELIALLAALRLYTDNRSRPRPLPKTGRTT